MPVQPPPPKDPTSDKQVFPSKKPGPPQEKPASAPPPVSPLPSTPPSSSPPPVSPTPPPSSPPTPPSRPKPEVAKPQEEKSKPPWMVVPPTMQTKKAAPPAKPPEPGSTEGPGPGVPPSSTPPPVKIPPQERAQMQGLIKKSPFRKIVPFILGILVILLFFFLVTKVILPFFLGRKEKEAKPVTLTYWGLWEESEIISPVIQDYKAENPHVSINYIYQSPKDYRERLQSAFARKEEPDIFRFHNTWVPMLKKELGPVPPTIFSQEEFENTFYQVALRDLSSQAQIVGVPLMYDGLALFYNPSLLEAAGKSVPETWDQLRQTAQEITVYDDKNKIQTAGVALGTTENVEHFSDILGLMILQNGADPADASDQLTQDALVFYTLFKTRDHVWDETLSNSIYAFAIEKVAMIFAPSWQVFTIKDINPSLNFKTAPVPQLSDEQLTWASFWAEGVSAQSENQEEAFKFLKYLSSQAVMRKFYNTASQKRAFGEPYSRMDLAQELEDDPLVGAFIKQAPKAKSWYLASRTYDNGLNDRLIKYYQDAINSLVQGEAAAEVFETLESGVSQVLSQYGL